MFTKKNFVQIATVLVAASPNVMASAGWDAFYAICDGLIELFQDDNAKFDRERFLSTMVNLMNQHQREAFLNAIERAEGIRAPVKSPGPLLPATGVLREAGKSDVEKLLKTIMTGLPPEYK